jgi:hypothetical protein
MAPCEITLTGGFSIEETRMKTMTKCTLLAAAAACTISTGCDSEDDLQKYRRETDARLCKELRVLEYDGCEYVLFAPYTYAGLLTHKGNCKYCEQRRNKQK